MTNKQLEQINIKIAKKLGWKKFRKERLPDPLQREKRVTGISPGNWRYQFIPAYTNNLAYAMQLVDWAIEHGYYTFRLEKKPLTAYEASFSDGKTKFVCWGTLPSVAICMAFLKRK